MAAVLDLSRPLLAYYSVPAALFLAFAPALVKTALAGKNADPAHPRNVLANCEKDASLDKKTIRRIQRADAAMANGFESLGFYAGAVAAALAAGVNPDTLNKLCAGYIASRALYNVVYVFLQDNRKFAPVRSMCWTVSIGLATTLWVKAGNKAVA